MGRLVRKLAAAETIFSDVGTTMTNAVAKGGEIQAIVEAELKPTATMIETVEADLAAAKKIFVPLDAALVEENKRADGLLGCVYDDLWNELGRPGHDRWLAMLFPGGIGYYADGDVETQPDRMELLAQLLERGVHPKLPQAVAQSAADRVRAGAVSLAAAVEAVRSPEAKVELFERIRLATARVAQFELAGLKRTLISKGYSEKQIHELIPDHKQAKKREE